MKKNSLAVNSIFNVIYKGFTALFPLITASYIARTLLPEKLGLVSYAQTIVTYFTTLASLGLPNYGVKYISNAGNNIAERSKNFFELFTINGISTSVFLALYYSIVNNFTYFQNKRLVLNVMGLLLILNYFNVDWFYQGIEEYRIISVRSIIVKVLSFVLVVFL